MIETNPQELVARHLAQCQRAADEDDVREAVSHLKAADRILHALSHEGPASWMSHALVEVEQLRHALEVPAREWEEHLLERAAHYRERERNAARSRGVNDHGPWTLDGDD